MTTLLSACLLPVAGFADVVPPRAVEVAEGWLALVDRGDYRQAVERFFDAPRSEEARSIATRLAEDASKRGAVKVRTRAIRSWGGTGEGDTTRMEPGAYFSLVFDTTDASGKERTDEVRMVPRGDGDWRVVDYLRRP